MYALLLLAVVVPAAPTPDTPPLTPKGTPPVQCVASIDSKGQLTIARMMPACCEPAVELRAELKRPGKEPLTALVTPKVTRMEMTIVELPADAVQAYNAYGKPISADDLKELLKKERTVLMSVDGKKVDPSLLQLYKEDTIVLVPPAALWGVESKEPVPEPDPKDEKK